MRLENHQTKTMTSQKSQRNQEVRQKKMHKIYLVFWKLNDYNNISSKNAKKERIPWGKIESKSLPYGCQKSSVREVLKTSHASPDRYIHPRSVWQTLTANSDRKVSNVLTVLFPVTLWSQSWPRKKKKSEIAAASVWHLSRSQAHLFIIVFSPLQEKHKEEMTMAKLTESMSE